MPQLTCAARPVWLLPVILVSARRATRPAARVSQAVPRARPAAMDHARIVPAVRSKSATVHARHPATLPLIAPLVVVVPLTFLAQTIV